VSGVRFGLLAGALGLAVAAASFAGGLAVLDDGEPDPPPRGGAPSDTTAAPIDTTSTTTSTTVAEDLLVSPSWVAVVASAATEIEAQRAATVVAAKRYPSGVLLSDDYPSLKAGLWVAYAGPYPDRATAEAAVSALADDGIGGAYARCAGTVADCSSSDGRGNGNGGDGDDDG
jgi:hypothetical protein